MRVLIPPLPHSLSLHHMPYLVYFQRITGPFAFKIVYGILGIGSVFTFRLILKVNRFKDIFNNSNYDFDKHYCHIYFFVYMIALILLLSIFSIHISFRLEGIGIDNPQLFN